MKSKRPQENIKSKAEQKIHKTVKNKMADGKPKGSKIGKISDPRKSNNETKNTTKSRHTNEKSKKLTVKKQGEKTLLLDEDDVEGMTVPPKAEPPASPGPSPSPSPRAAPRPAQRPTRPSQPAARPARPAPSAKPRDKHQSSEGEDDDDEETDTTVKQFSFPAYKILSGASVAPVRMYPQKVVVKPSVEPSPHWGAGLTGLFQNSKLTLKLRMLRLLLIWIFFRVLNKQTAWLSDILGIGIPDEEPPGPKVKPPPGERFIKVFREGDPNPYHVRVKRPL